ncbi:hypothetical protein [Bdellovibrio bacteriovorus]|uniref:hypothetical protein n=1 Tax=Bdellovibrio bacteriovorus TaxID=959 RepID=UPI003D073EEB
MLKKLILAATVLSLAACAFDQDKNAGKQREIELNGKLQQTYKPVIGTYVGQITTADGTQDLEVKFFELKVDNGAKNSDGSTRLHSTLYATYKRINPAGESYDFVVGFAPETGDLTLVNVKDIKSLGRDEIQTVDAKISGNNILGEAKAISGPKGIVKLYLKARENESTGGGKEEFAYYERLRAQLTAISGTYVGQMDQGNSGPVKGIVGITLRLYVQETVKEGSTVTIPRLMGELNRADDPGHTADLTLTGVYEADLAEPRLTLTGKPARDLNSKFEAAIYGKLVNGVLEGALTSNYSMSGKLILKKQ